MNSVNMMLFMIALPIALIFDAFIYRFFGNTPGKALLGLKVTESNGDNLSLDDYFQRNMGVWVRGLWFGIPLISFIPMLIQSHRLHNGQSASYDTKENYLVSGKPVGWGQGLLFTTLFVLVLFANWALNTYGTLLLEKERASAPTTQRGLSPEELQKLSDEIGSLYEAPSAKQSTSTPGPTDANEQFEMSRRYYEGDGVPQDDAQAAAWLRKAAEQGYAMAQFNLGIMYANGQGVPQDDAQAVAWLRKAAEQGLAMAQNSLGFKYDKGQGVSQDDAQAAAWYRKAAEQGGAIAQYNLGFMYYSGRGVPQSNIVAYALFRLAASQDADAATALEKLASSMTAQDIAKAQNLARDMAKPGNFGRALDKYLTR